jgi:hypothetical protein
MKHSFIAFSIFASITVSFIACSKKDMFEERNSNPSVNSLIAPLEASGLNNGTPRIKVQLTAKADTPYGKVNNPILSETGIKIITTARPDTPYGKINNPLSLEHGINIIPIAKPDTPYGKVNIPVSLEPGIIITSTAKPDTPYRKINVAFVKS